MIGQLLEIRNLKREQFSHADAWIVKELREMKYLYLNQIRLFDEASL